MMKFMSKFVIILMISLILMGRMGIANIAFAKTGEQQLEESVEHLNNPGTDEDDPYKILADIMSLLSWGGFALATFKLMQIGINFMTGVGSKRSQAKDSLFPWALGCGICALFGLIGPWIISIIADGDNGDIFSMLFFF